MKCFQTPLYECKTSKISILFCLEGYDISIRKIFTVTQSCLKYQDIRLIKNHSRHKHWLQIPPKAWKHSSALQHCSHSPTDSQTATPPYCTETEKEQKMYLLFPTALGEQETCKFLLDKELRGINHKIAKLRFSANNNSMLSKTLWGEMTGRLAASIHSRQPNLALWSPSDSKDDYCKPSRESMSSSSSYHKSINFSTMDFSDISLMYTS